MFFFVLHIILVSELAMLCDCEQATDNWADACMPVTREGRKKIEWSVTGGLVA